MRYLISLVLVSFSWVLLAADAETLLTEAQAIYDKRPEGIEAAVPKLKEALTLTEDESLRYRIRLLHAMVLYWQGDHADTDDAKKALFLEGKELSDAGIEESPDYAELYYWSAAHLGSWAVVNGPLASLGKKGEIIETAEKLYETETLGGEPGEDYNWRGADRILGRLYFKLPSFAGGSLDKSLKYLKAAYEKGSAHAVNVNYYAESLFNGNAAQKATAKEILDEMLGQDPLTYNAERVPETLEEFEEARALRNQMGE